MIFFCSVLNYFKTYKAERANKFIAYFQNFTNTYAPIDILKEMSLCTVDFREFDLIEFHVDLAAGRVDLESSPLLKRLRTQREK